jgi:hypothetical protein
MDRYAIEEDAGFIVIDTGNKIEGPPPGSSLVDEPPRGPSCAGETHA